MNLNELVEINTNNARPSIAHPDKAKQSADIAREIEEFIARGGKPELVDNGVISNKGRTARERSLYTYNQAKANGRRMDEPLKAK